jgi:hypothetical protein
MRRRRAMTEDEADHVLDGSSKVDDFARALDQHGWMIVGKPEFDDGLHTKKWSMFCPCDDCPSWAEPADLPKPKPTLRLIDGDKPDQPQP